MSSQFSRKGIEAYSLLFILLGVFALSILIISPYLNALLGASVAAIIFEPVYRKILKGLGNRESLAALLTILIITALIIGPLVLIGRQVFIEGRALYVELDDRSGSGVLEEIQSIVTNRFDAVLPVDAEAIDQFIKGVVASFSDQVGSIFSSVFSMLIRIAIGIFALYYFLKDGERIRKYIIEVSPLADHHTTQIVEKLRLTIQATIRGSLIVAFAQGLLLGIGLLIFGIPNTSLWSLLGFIAALVPALGTTLITIPIFLFLLLTNQVFQAVGFLIWGIVVVGLADNLIRPKLLGKHVGLHPFLVFLSVIGGLSFFGAMGILWGPIILSLLAITLESYPMVVEQK